MKLSEFSYQRPDINLSKSKFKELISSLKKKKTAEEQNEIITEINELRKDFDTMMTLAGVNYSQDTTNDEFQKEQDYFDKVSPEFKGLETDYYQAISSSEFKEELKKKWGRQLFSIAEMSAKTFSDSILGDLVKENQLSSEYTKLLSSARIDFEGKERNLSEMEPFLNSTSRETRKAAQEAKYGFYASNSNELDRLFDELVKTRAAMAKKLGYTSFVEMGYNRMLRGDYNADMVRDYRETIHKYIVPLATNLRNRQRERLGLDHLYYYDEPLEFKSGNPVPKGDPAWIQENASKMYEELSPETKEFFEFMQRNELLDLVARKGKAPGGYCTIFSKYKSPFIFSNFNGTAHDIIVLTHEAGHAFQVYSSRDAIVPEYFFPTYEACEIHSMSMEFLTWPWMNLFFKEDTDKFKFSHINKAILFLPYGVAVDEFQHEIYANPELTPAERKKRWREIEKKYIPSRDYDTNSFLEEGGYWQQQRHIYNMPFYYIDYTLAQICAFQFWMRSEENGKQALDDYINLCKAGGSLSFLELVKLARLESPFTEGCVKSVKEKLETFIDSVDEKHF